MPYIGRPLNAGNLAVQSGTGDGADTTPIATLDYSVGSSNSIGVYLDGVRQLAGTDFTASGTTLTFTTAPANGVGIDVYFLGLELSIPTPADATVTAAKLASDAVTTAKILNNAVDETKLKDALVADFTEVVVAAGDSILLGDATDSGNTKRDTIQGILDLVTAGASVSVVAQSYDMSTASGNVDVTGFGFNPSAVYGMLSNNGADDWGFCITDLTTHRTLHSIYTTTAVLGISNNFAHMILSSGNSQSGTSVTSITDGIRIAFTKTGSPTGTMWMLLLGIA